MKKIEFKFRKLFSGKNIGNLKSFFMGHGLDLQDFRRYQVGDEPRYINWKLSAKFGELFVKLFKIEKDVDIYVYFDLNINWAGGNDRSYFEQISEVFAEIMILARKYGANVKGLYHDKSNQRHILPIGKDFQKATDLISKLGYQISIQGSEYRSNLSDFLDFQKTISKSRVIIVFSDFLDLSDKQKQLIKGFSSRSEVMLIKVDFPLFQGLNFNNFTLDNAKLLNNELKLIYLDEIIS